MHNLALKEVDTEHSSFSSIGETVARNAPQNDYDRSFDYQAWSMLAEQGVNTGIKLHRFPE